MDLQKKLDELNATIKTLTEAIDGYTLRRKELQKQAKSYEKLIEKAKALEK